MDICFLASYAAALLKPESETLSDVFYRFMKAQSALDLAHGKLQQEQVDSGWVVEM